MVGPQTIVVPQAKDSTTG
uniref:Uncharacterized protein n=1 Tax=Anguilla anguilla TaxID=7936 RepID=A0A0E9P5B4_ANGAN